MIPIARPLIGDEEKSLVLEVLSSGQLAQGPRVREFETRFAEWVGARYAVATSSGTAALHVALLAHGLGPGDEVITTPFSFIASANCALFVGARPVFADIEPDYFTLDPDAVEAKLTPRTRAIVPVHLYGQPCDMPRLAAIAQAHDLILIEDACQAHGAQLDGRPVGSWGTACYSFYPTKNMTTIEGGMLTTNRAEIAERARLIRDHGSPKRYQHDLLGYNLRLTDLQAAVGLAQLAKVDAWNDRRRANAAWLDARLAGLDGIQTPHVRPGARHVYHQYTLRARDRTALLPILAERGIGVGIHYPTPIHQQPLYQRLGYSDSLPEAERACREVLSLPIHASLTEEDLRCIAEALEAVHLTAAPAL
jgi:dTDP-4-amino-4,6-dideoxygalactose transaminase